MHHRHLVRALRSQPTSGAINANTSFKDKQHNNRETFTATLFKTHKEQPFFLKPFKTFSFFLVNSGTLIWTRKREREREKKIGHNKLEDLIVALNQKCFPQRFCRLPYPSKVASYGCAQWKEKGIRKETHRISQDKGTLGSCNSFWKTLGTSCSDLENLLFEVSFVWGPICPFFLCPSKTEK